MNTNLIRRIARAVIATTPQGVVDIDDLIQAGALGLIEAESRREQDVGSDSNYEAWAAMRIRGAMIDELRSMDWMSRDSRKMAKKVSESLQRLTQQLGRTPTDTEVSTDLNISLVEYRQVQRWCNGGPVSIDAMLNDDPTAENFIERYVVDNTYDPLIMLAEHERSKEVAQAVKCLSQKEQTILNLLLEDVSSKVIAEQLSLSEGRISQLRKKIITKLRHSLVPML